MKKRIVITVGCRPDCIKMMPLVKKLMKRSGTEIVLLSANQHYRTLDQVFNYYQEAKKDSKQSGRYRNLNKLAI